MKSYTPIFILDDLVWSLLLLLVTRRKLKPIMALQVIFEVPWQRPQNWNNSFIHVEHRVGAADLVGLVNYILVFTPKY